jgi:DNA ligase-1
MGELTVIANDEIMDRILPKIKKEDLKNDTNLAEELISQYNEAKSKNVKFILPRQIGNGLLISDDVPHENIVVELWDCVSLEEYKIAGLGEKNCETQYKTRFETLINILDDNNNEKIQVIPYIIVNNLEEAVNQTSIWMKEGFEGAILKDFKGVFKDGTSKHQLKLKIAFTIDVRIVGFIEGTKGTKREKTFASLVFETDDKMIQGSVSSGLTDKLLAEINSNREEYLSKIIEIEGNDLTQGRGNDYYAVSHPRIIEIRNDKNKTDDLERAFENLEMAKLFKDRE